MEMFRRSRGMLAFGQGRLIVYFIAGKAVADAPLSELHVPLPPPPSQELLHLASAPADVYSNTSVPPQELQYLPGGGSVPAASDGLGRAILQLTTRRNNEQQIVAYP